MTNLTKWRVDYEKEKTKNKALFYKKEGKIGQKNAGIAMEYYTKEIHYNIIRLYSLNKKETEKTKKKRVRQICYRVIAS